MCLTWLDVKQFFLSCFCFSALKDVKYVIHGIKPAAAQPAAQEGEAPVQPAVEGVLNVFKASMAAKSVKRIILTSSYQAIAGKVDVFDHIWFIILHIYFFFYAVRTHRPNAYPWCMYH